MGKLLVWRKSLLSILGRILMGRILMGRISLEILMLISRIFLAADLGPAQFGAVQFDTAPLGAAQLGEELAHQLGVLAAGRGFDAGAQVDAPRPCHARRICDIRWLEAARDQDA